MKDAVIALVEAVRVARLELALYRDPVYGGTSEFTIDRLAQLLGDKSVDQAMAVLAPDEESPSIIPQATQRVLARH